MCQLVPITIGQADLHHVDGCIENDIHDMTEVHRNNDGSWGCVLGIPAKVSAYLIDPERGSRLSEVATCVVDKIDNTPPVVEIICDAYSEDHSGIIIRVTDDRSGVGDGTSGVEVTKFQRQVDGNWSSSGYGPTKITVEREGTDSNNVEFNIYETKKDYGFGRRSGRISFSVKDLAGNSITIENQQIKKDMYFLTSHRKSFADRWDGANDQALYNNSGQPMWVFHQIDDISDDYRCRYVFVQYGGTKAQVWKSSTYNDDLLYSGGSKVWGDEIYKFTFTYHGQEHPVSYCDWSKTRCEQWSSGVNDYWSSDIGRELGF